MLLAPNLKQEIQLPFFRTSFSSHMHSGTTISTRKVLPWIKRISSKRRSANRLKDYYRSGSIQERVDELNQLLQDRKSNVLCHRLVVGTPIHCFRTLTIKAARQPENHRRIFRCNRPFIGHLCPNRGSLLLWSCHGSLIGWAAAISGWYLDLF